MRRNIYGLTYDNLENEILSSGGKKFNTKQIWQWLYRKDTDDFEAMSDLSKDLRKILNDKFCSELLELEEKHESMDGTIKFLWKLKDGKSVESVLIPEDDRVTVCISSQVGCKFNCSFCTTGKMGFLRNLSVDEIVAEVISMQKMYDRRISNVVYMGMGEPFDNYQNVIDSASILSDDRGLAIGARKITISTVGKVDGIQRYTEEDQRYRLAISLHSPFDNVRSSIMPINKKFQIKELFDTLKKYAEKSKRKVVFEYILLDGLNDRKEDMQELKTLLKTLPSKLNLIRFHNNPYSEFKCPDERKIYKFYQEMQNRDFPVVIRASRGEDVAAACGQLGMDKMDGLNRLQQ
ncbi:MAG: 23S rRNA (adenine(2503)-C(2))-methyltransferase RlmN [Candidatus Delongbacteria bacterium]|nr:23S rRNA (adenine(2503)-C(2))-methyltransferase RlmN [Candidatus Delongbacteria bacterium]MBN2833831.1 23S rRNA (adenine(2503)-C(2))-methyltransferase RlmN [Candidatus Delongbacteria bacterium]